MGRRKQRRQRTAPGQDTNQHHDHDYKPHNNDPDPEGDENDADDAIDHEFEDDAGDGWFEVLQPQSKVLACGDRGDGKFDIYCSAVPREREKEKLVP